MFAVSWLTGTAQRWFEPNLALPDHELPQYARVWGDFVEALQSTFGEPNPFTSATNKLNNLVMKNHHHLNKYDVKFSEYATLTGFNERALFARYYKGLAPRLKDAMLYGPRPTTYTQLRERAQECDLRYWEHNSEDRPQASDAKASGSSSSQSFGTSSATSSDSSKTASASKNPSRSSTPASSSSEEQSDCSASEAESSESD